MLTPEQERAHYPGIGSSTAAAIVGLDPHCSPYQAWQRLKFPETRPDLSGSTPVALGNRFESVICELAAERWGLQLLPPNPQLTLYHKDVPYFLAHPDAVAGNVNACVEAKFRGPNMRRYYEENDGEPLDIEYIQSQWLCMVGGYEAVYLCVVLGNTEVRHWHIPANPEDIQFLYHECQDFWKTYVEPGIPPDAYDADDIRAKYPFHLAGKTIETTSTIAAAVEQSLALREHIDQLQAKDEELKAQIISAFNDAESLRYDGRVIATFKTQTRRDIDIRRLRAEAPNVANTFARESMHRVLRLKATVPTYDVAGSALP